MADTIVWIDALGAEHQLTDQAGLEIPFGLKGRFMPPFSLLAEEVPGQPGARLREVTTKARRVEIPLEVVTSSATALRARLRELAGWFAPDRGDGRLKVTAPDASQRELTCRYREGLEMFAEGEDSHLANWARLVLVLEAQDPYWYESSTQVVTYAPTTLATFFPIFPLRLSSSEVFADGTVANDGDVSTWPTWTITGPGSALVIRNLTTGEMLSLSYTLAAGSTITIDTRPGVKTVKLSDGTNLHRYLSATSSLWALARGSNSVRIELTGATAASSVQLTYRRRYLAP